MAAPSLFLCAQIGALFAATTAAAALPPREGAILLVSPAGHAAGWALDGDTRLIGAGPAGTLIVWGDGASIARRAWAHGALALRAPRTACGSRA